jgi:hypothetical protein
MLIGSLLRKYVVEWMPTTLQPLTVILFLLMFGAIVLLARRGSRISLFERLALPMLVIAALLAWRNGIWFGRACVASLPVLLDEEFKATRRPRSQRRSLRVLTAGMACGVAVIAVALTLSRPTSVFAPRFSSDAARAVAVAAGAHGRVLADDVHSDWLLWTHPELVGRVAYDSRIELLSRRQLASLVAFRAFGVHRALARRYRVLTFGSLQEARPFLHHGRLVYRSPDFFVLVQGKSPKPA